MKWGSRQNLQFIRMAEKSLSTHDLHVAIGRMFPQALQSTLQLTVLAIRTINYTNFAASQRAAQTDNPIHQ